MVKREQKIIVASAMHGRQKTVKFCLNKLSDLGLHVYMAYTTAEDGEFLKQFNHVTPYKIENTPLARKWNHIVKQLENVDFDAVVLLGSDDFIDRSFLKFIRLNIMDYDMIAFTDMYFLKNEVNYYWGGYQNHRIGEPAGAGKTYSKQFLNRINYNLFNDARDRGLDGVSWLICLEANANMLITSMKEHRIKCVDVKDGEGMTKLERIPNVFML